jgi:SAM-dependent methyltransferase
VFTNGRRLDSLDRKVRSQVGVAVGRGKRTSRKLIDRVVQPYLDQAVDRMTPAPAAAEDPPLVAMTEFREFHAVLHEARSIALAGMPRGASTILSAGASGLWYFEWFEAEYGPVDRHIGVEAYLPKPAGLPANVEWVGADLAGPEGVATVSSGDIDLVFSGQNIEHLWPEQVVAFLLESHRVLRTGGWLIVDSPNRDFTEPYRWSMGEHTVEFTVDETIELFELAGFTVEHMKGVWLCRDRDGMLPLEPSPESEARVPVLRRFALAADHPHDSFIWWAEARKAGEPDAEKLLKRILDIYEDVWPERASRLNPLEGEPALLPDGRPGVVMAAGTPGYAMIGPFMAVTAGSYEFAVEVAWSDAGPNGGSIGVLEVLARSELLASSEVVATTSQGSARVVCAVELDALRFDVHVRLLCTGKGAVSAPLEMQLSPDPWR